MLRLGCEGRRKKEAKKLFSPTFFALCELGFYRFSFRLVRYVVSLFMEISLWIFSSCVGFTLITPDFGPEGVGLCVDPSGIFRFCLFSFLLASRRKQKRKQISTGG
jgi:hypothetical protein